MNGRKRKITSLFLAFITLISLSISAKDYFELPLWITKDSLKKENSTIRVYIPESPNGITIIACPGGGYRYLEINKEGYAFAPWFNKRGITFVVLNYRLPSGNPEIPLEDAKQAIRLIRSHSKEWGINPDKVGIMGSSAGGHVASTLATHFDPATRPDFQILLYPAITMNNAYAHPGSLKELLGDEPTRELIKLYSNEYQVTSETPPAFIVLSDDDGIVSSPNSVNYYLALKKNKVPAEMHIYPTGGHGWGMSTNYKYYQQWTMSLEEWIKNLF